MDRTLSAHQNLFPTAHARGGQTQQIQMKHQLPVNPYARIFTIELTDLAVSGVAGVAEESLVGKN